MAQRPNAIGVGRSSTRGAVFVTPCLLWVKNAILNTGWSLLVFPNKQTYSVPFGMSQGCQQRKSLHLLDCLFRQASVFKGGCYSVFCFL